jgi:hypothetical protein
MRTLIAVAALAAAVSGTMSTPGHADPPSAAGFACRFSDFDPSSVVPDGSPQKGQLDGGPVAVADLPYVDDTLAPPAVLFDTTGNPASATITCALQVGGTGGYADTNVVDASASASGTVVVYLPPTVVTYAAAATDPLWVCTTWTLTDANGDSETLYLDDATGEFSTDPTTARCAHVTSQQYL